MNLEIIIIISDLNTTKTVDIQFHVGINTSVREIFNSADRNNVARQTVKEFLARSYKQEIPLRR
jgi:hypothetical protein